MIAHDYLTQRGGAERVVLAMLTAFPDARIVTSIYDAEATYQEFRNCDVQTSWLSKVSAFRRDPRRALALLAPTWSATHIDDADVVICSSTGWAHGVRTQATKIVYCHNPARWLYQADEYLSGAGPVTRAGMKVLRPSLRAWDQRAARSATTYLANSTVVADRIATTYDVEAEIVHPPSAISTGPVEPIPGIEPGFLLTVGRSRGYKNTGAVAHAVRDLPGERLVAVGGVPHGDWPARIRGLNDISDSQLRWLYRNADALVACAYEDFGLTPIEAYSVGTPAVVLRAGGYLDTSVPGVTGEFVATAEPADIASGIRRFRQSSYSTSAIETHGKSFSVDEFAAKLRNVVLKSYLAGPLIA
ncbi:glycosyltransferase [uncultured Jatrophihabitans sp.]|uniref:glycosyltransferase n=1 Tax=uncultured Jatrophihabitans sp. TaxID=1610747 RepID=UPI0035CAEB55